MFRRAQRSTRTETLIPDTTLFVAPGRRSARPAGVWPARLCRSARCRSSRACSASSSTTASEPPVRRDGPVPRAPPETDHRMSSVAPLPQQDDALPQPYLLFLGDIVEPAYAKTAFGLRDWAPERCVGEFACVGAKVSAGLAPMRSEEHTSETQSLMRISYAVFRLKKKQTRK